MRISMNKKIALYDGKKQLLASIPECLLLYLFFLIITNVLYQGKRGFLFFDMYMLIIYTMSDSVKIFHRQGRYMIFSYCRKTFFRLQIVYILLCSIIWGSFQSISRIAHYPYIVQEYIEGTKELPSMYHMPPLAELFIIDILYFFMLSLFILWDSTKPVPFFIYTNLTEERSPYMEQQVKERKKKRTLTGTVLYIVRKFLGFVLMLVFCVFPIFFFQLQLQKPLSYRLLAYLIIMAVTFLFYVLAKRRFTPKYM